MMRDDGEMNRSEKEGETEGGITERNKPERSSQSTSTSKLRGYRMNKTKSLGKLSRGLHSDNDE